MRAVFRLYLLCVLLVAFCLRAGGQTVLPNYVLHIAGWSNDIVLGSSWWEQFDIDTTGGIPVFSSTVRNVMDKPGCNHFLILRLGSLTFWPATTDYPDHYILSFSGRWSDRGNPGGTSLIGNVWMEADFAYVILPQQKGAGRAPWCFFDSSQFELEVFP